MKPNEHLRAKRWRESHSLTPQRLSELSGYSTPAIFWFEKGLTPPMRNAKGGHAQDRKIKAWVWWRYRMVCSAIDYALKTGQSFDW